MNQRQDTQVLHQHSVRLGRCPGISAVSRATAVQCINTQHDQAGGHSQFNWGNLSDSVGQGLMGTIT